MALGGAGPLVFDDPFAARRLRLPVRDGGFGLRERAVQAPAAFLGRVAAAAPTMAKAVPGAVAALFGDGAFDRKNETRYGGLVSSGSRLGYEFWDAYAAVKRGVMESLRVTDVDDPALGLLRRPAASAGLALTAAAKGVPLTYAQNLQSDLTRAYEAALLVELKRDAAALPGPELDRRAASLEVVDRFSGQFLLCAPSRIPLKNDEYAEIAANYAGLPSPACLKLLDEPVLGDPALRLRAAKAEPDPGPDPTPDPPIEPGGGSRAGNEVASAGSGCEITHPGTGGGPVGLWLLVTFLALAIRHRRA